MTSTQQTMPICKQAPGAKKRTFCKCARLVERESAREREILNEEVCSKVRETQHVGPKCDTRLK